MRHRPHLLQGLSFAVFGLGNKQYEHFAAVGKRVNKALVSLGATAVCRRGALSPLTSLMITIQLSGMV